MIRSAPAELSNHLSAVDIANAMCVAMARALPARGIVALGVGSIMPMVAIFAARELGKDITIITIANSVDPHPHELPQSTMSLALWEASTSTIQNDELYDLIAQGRVEAMFLGGGQIDRTGAINSSWIGDCRKPRARLPGGGGAAFLLPLVRNVFIWRLRHSKRIFPEKVDFVTSKGNLKKVITPKCVFGASEDGLKLETIFPSSNLVDIQDNTGFRVSDPGGNEASWTAPTEQEIAAINKWDPSAIRLWGLIDRN